MLPLLQNEVVATGWVSEQDFLTGFALVQAMPGPLFNFAAYLGTLSTVATASTSPKTLCCDQTSAEPQTVSKVEVFLLEVSCRCRSAGRAGKIA